MKWEELVQLHEESWASTEVLEQEIHDQIAQAYNMSLQLNAYHTTESITEKKTDALKAEASKIFKNVI